MKTIWKVFLIIGIIVFLLISSIIVLSLIKKDTYIANLRLEATSGYPPKLTVLRDEGIVKETGLLSIMPKINLPRLSAYIHTSMSGTIQIDCGEEYQETKNFNLVTDNPGDKMIHRFAFKSIPSDRVCLIEAQVLECETELEACNKNKISLTLRIPE